VTLSPLSLNVIETLAVIAGVGYAVLAARRNRLCWIIGALASVLAGIAYHARALPMQAALQVFYVGMSVYGWLGWSRNANEGEVIVGVWPLPWHIGAAIALTLLSLLSAHLLAADADAAWPRIDSLTTWFSLLATWLAARGRLENWLYWIIIDGLLVFVCIMQRSIGMALLNFMLMGIAAGGYVAWRRSFRTQALPA
jgi:nicotinamide mononucleotide transporter